MDRARVQIGRISRFGLLEMSRQRLRASLGESNYTACPRCAGTGHIRGIASSALHILRIIEEEALKENTEAIHAHLPTETATYLLNEKRSEVTVVENRLGSRIVIIPTENLETPNFQIRRLRADELNEIQQTPSYMLEQQEADTESDVYTVETRREVAAVGLEHVQPSTPPAATTTPPATAASPGFLKRFLDKVFTGTAKTPAEEQTKKPASSPRRQPAGNRSARNRRPNQRNTNRNTRNQPQQKQSQSGKGESKASQKKGNADSRSRRGRGRSQQPAQRRRSERGANPSSNPGSARNRERAAAGADNKPELKADAPETTANEMPPASVSEPMQPQRNTADPVVSTPNTEVEQAGAANSESTPRKPVDDTAPESGDNRGQFS